MPLTGIASLYPCYRVALKFMLSSVQSASFANLGYQLLDVAA